MSTCIWPVCVCVCVCVFVAIFRDRCTYLHLVRVILGLIPYHTFFYPLTFLQCLNPALREGDPTDVCLSSVVLLQITDFIHELGNVFVYRFIFSVLSGGHGLPEKQKRFARPEDQSLTVQLSSGHVLGYSQHIL